MKKFGFFITIFALMLFSCKSEERKQKDREATYYLNEDFILIAAKEDVAGGDNGSPYKVRTWVIERQVREWATITGLSDRDTVQRAEIITPVSNKIDNDCGCNDESNFVITDELWYGKPVGSKLHFDYIRKDRFFKIAKKEQPILSYETITNKPTEEPVQETGTQDKMEVELEVLRLERELSMLKEKLKSFN